MSTWKIFSDGGARGNPGPAAYGFLVFDGQKELHSDKRFLGVATNNVAEYRGLLAAIEWVFDNIKDTVSDLEFVMDSELVVKQMKGEYKIKSPDLLEIAQKIKSIQKKFDQNVVFTHVKREDNKQADLLVNQAIDSHT